MIFKLGIKSPDILIGISKPFKILRKYRLNDFSKPNDAIFNFKKNAPFYDFQTIMVEFFKSGIDVIFCK
ncbi:MAG: hypothetical protein ACI9XO_002490 [Paraglaciecola sp.]|jgi:hypothetical protein